MNDVDDRLRQLVYEMTDSAPPAGPVPVAAPVVALRRRPQRRMMVAIAAAAVLLVGGAVVWRQVGFDSSTVTADVTGGGSGAGGTALPNPDVVLPTPGVLENLGDQQWAYPTFLPDGVEFKFAMTTTTRIRNVWFVGGDESTVLVTIGTFSPEEFGGAFTERVIGGVTWLRGSTGRFFLEASSGWLSVVGLGIEEDAVVEVISSLIVVDDLGLPRPPIDMVNGPFVEVARANQDGTEAVLEITTDGLHYGTNTRNAGDETSGSGCCSVLKEGDLLIISGTSGRGPGAAAVGEVAAGDGLIWALADESVATVEIRLVDGSVITTRPQDTNDAFPVDFLFVAVPEAGGDIFGTVDEFVAFDADGNELGSGSMESLGIAIKANDATTDEVGPQLPAGVVSTWVNQTGVQAASDDVWPGRLERACSEGIWKAAVAQQLAGEFINEDGANESFFADGRDEIDLLENAASALWTMAIQVCRDDFPPDAIAAGPFFDFRR